MSAGWPLPSIRDGGSGGCKLALHFHLLDPAGQDATSNSCQTCPGRSLHLTSAIRWFEDALGAFFGEAGSPGSGRRRGQLAGIGPCWALLPGRGCLSQQVLLSRAGHSGHQLPPNEAVPPGLCVNDRGRTCPFGGKQLFIGKGREAYTNTCV